MQWFRNLAFLIFISNGVLTASAQEKKEKAEDIHSLFADLPIADESKNSILKENESASEKIKKNIFVKADMNLPSAYLGQPILVTYRLFTSLKSRSQINSRPALINFSAVEMPINNDQIQDFQMGGKNFRVFKIWQVQLNPFQDGNLTLDPLVVDNTVDYVGDDNKVHNYSGAVKSNQLNFTILPLPEKGKPDGFSGIVGRFSLRTAVERTNIEAGEMNNLHIEIKGSGNFDNIYLPSITWPKGFDHFIVKEGLVPGKNEFPPSGKKTFDIPFVSNQNGSFELPAISLSFFDPSKKMYLTATSNPILLSISAALAKEKQKKPPSAVVGKDDKGLTKYAWILLGTLGTVAALFFLIRKHRLDKIAEQNRIKEAEIAARELINQRTDFRKELENLAGVENDAQYIEQVKSLLTKLLQEKFNTSLVLEEELLLFLNQEANDEELVLNVQEVYSRCSRLLYAPTDRGSIRASIAGPLARILDSVHIPAQANEIE